MKLLKEQKIQTLLLFLFQITEKCLERMDSFFTEIVKKIQNNLKFQ